MSKELYNKASKTKILSSLPSRSLGRDGDIVLSSIKGKGTYLCAKSKGEWYVANKLEELRKLEKTSIRDLSVNKLRLGDAALTKQEYNTNEDFTLDSNGDIILDSVLGSSKGLFLKNSGATYSMIDYHHNATYVTLYPNGGDTTDDYFRINVREYGETELETTHNAGDAGHLTLDVDGQIKLDSSSGIFKFMLAGDTNDLCTLTVEANGATTIATADSDGTVGHLTLDVDGDIELNADGGDISFKDDSADLAALSSSGLTINNISEVGSDTDKFLTSDSGVVKYVTGANLRSYIGAGTSSVGALDDLSDVTYSGGDLTITSLDTIVSGALTFNSSGDIALSADGGNVTMDDGTTTVFDFDVDNVIFKMMDDADTGDYLQITVGTNGETTLLTKDDNGATAHLNIEPDGHVEFDGCSVGFDLVTPTYNASDTNVDFQTGNKQFVTFGSGNITDLNLIFPATSGNFILMLKQDGTGSRTVTNYKAWDKADDDAASGSATVKFAGGSNPTLTTDANHVDIISIFYDADNQIAYGVTTLDFQF